MAGWLGDATLKVGSNKKPSFENDDYMANLDAENIAHMVRNKNYSFLNAVEDYYGRLLDAKRAKIFLEENNLIEVKKLIYDALLLVKYNDKLSRIALGDFKAKMELIELYNFESSNWLILLKNDKAPDTYNFIRSLEQELSEMGELK